MDKNISQEESNDQDNQQKPPPEVKSSAKDLFDEHSAKENTNPIDCATLSSIVHSYEDVPMIRLVVTRIYPTLFYICDEKGQKTILNEGRMTTKLGYRLPREVLAKQRIFSARGVDVAAYNLGDWSTSAVIHIPFSDDAMIPKVEEGEIVQFTHLIAGGYTYAKKLMGRPESIIIPFGKEGLVAGNLARQLSFGRDINDSDFNPTFKEIDYVGVIRHVGKEKDSGGQDIKCVEEDGQIIDIHFPESLREWSLEDVILKQKIIGFKNLFCRFGYVNASMYTSVHLEPDRSVLKDGFTRVKGHYDKIIKDHLSPIHSTLTTTSAAKTEFEFAIPSKPAPKKKFPALDPAKDSKITELDFVKSENLAGKKSSTSRPANLNPCIPGSEEKPTLTEDQKQSLESVKDVIVPATDNKPAENPNSKWNKFL